MVSHQFADRTEAGKALAESLARSRLADPVILALPRGGVPVALEVARALRAPIDVVLVRKIGVPGHREVAAAAVVDGGDAEIVHNRSVMRSARLDDAEVRNLAGRELVEIERRRGLYLGGRRRQRLEGRTLVIVDDGIATGATMRAAIAALKRKHPLRLVVAVPVAAPDVLDDLKHEVDDVVCIASPDAFHAVGEHYRDFHQVSDAEVIEALAVADALAPERTDGG